MPPNAWPASVALPTIGYSARLEDRALALAFPTVPEAELGRGHLLLVDVMLGVGGKKLSKDTDEFEEPKHWLNGKRVGIAIWLDDIQSSPIVSNKAFRNLCIKHRHIGSFPDGSPPIGCSIFCAIQNYTAQGGDGIPKAIRGNVNCVAIWRTGNTKELDLLMTELSGQIPKEKLLRAYHAVMNKDPDDRHACLFVDLNPKPHHPSPFRINYTDWLILDD